MDFLDFARISSRPFPDRVAANGDYLGDCQHGTPECRDRDHLKARRGRQVLAAGTEQQSRLRECVRIRADEARSSCERGRGGGAARSPDRSPRSLSQTPNAARKATKTSKNELPTHSKPSRMMSSPGSSSKAAQCVASTPTANANAPPVIPAVSGSRHAMNKSAQAWLDAAMAKVRAGHDMPKLNCPGIR